MSPEYSFLDAVSFAARAHCGQIRKDKETPYVAHVVRVGMIVRHVFGLDDPRILTTAFLHDTIEDTTTDFDDIAERYGEEIARWVALLTKNSKLPEPQREKEYLDGLDHAPWQVKAAKLADLLDNMLDSEALPADKKARSLTKYQGYFDSFRKWTEAELKRPLEIVAAALKSIT